MGRDWGSSPSQGAGRCRGQVEEAEVQGEVQLEEGSPLPAQGPRPTAGGSLWAAGVQREGALSPQPPLLAPSLSPVALLTIPCESLNSKQRFLGVPGEPELRSLPKWQGSAGSWTAVLFCKSTGDGSSPMRLWPICLLCAESVCASPSRLRIWGTQAQHLLDGSIYV